MKERKLKRKAKVKLKHVIKLSFILFFATVKKQNKTFSDLLILNSHGLFILFRFYLE